MTSHIEVADLSLTYHWQNYSKPIFNNLNLQIEQGQFVSVIGGNGSGKSSLFKLILGLTKPDSGQICIAGTPVRYGYPNGVRQGRIAYFAQDIQEMFFSETVGEELAFNRAQQQNSPVHFEFEPQTQRCITDLSGGERQALGLIEFMTQKADLLLLDEPSSFLDEDHASALKRFLNERHAAGKTIVHVTQYGNEIQWGSHVLDLDQDQPGVEAL